MEHLIYEMHDTDSAHSFLYKLARYHEQHPDTTKLIHIFSGAADDQLHYVNQLVKDIRDIIPDASIVALKTNAEIYDGHISRDQRIIVSLMSFDATTVTTRVYANITGHEEEYGRQILELINSTPDVKGVELLIYPKDADFRKLFNVVEKCDHSIEIFGGCSMGKDINNPSGFIADAEGRYDDSIAVTVFSSKQLQIYTDYTAGWKSLGRDFKLTRIKGSVVEQVDNFPAYDLYKRYLGINNPAEFASNSMDFPLILKSGEEEILRQPAALLEDGGLRLFGDLDGIDTATFAYGDPSTITRELDQHLARLNAFAPEGILIYSCVSRRMFWGDFIHEEIAPFQKMAPTSGFFTGGELTRGRSNHRIIWRNLTLTSISFKEHETAPLQEPPTVDSTTMHDAMSMVKRLATLIEETNKDLTASWDELKKMSITDTLTGLYNRAKLDDITEAVLNQNDFENIAVSNILFDIDDFKKVNDTYGHAVGDQVLSQFAQVLQDTMPSFTHIGRWGGEEFLVVVPGVDKFEAAKLADKARAAIENTDFSPAGRITASVGVSQAVPGEPHGNIFKATDKALYTAKLTGKNRVVVL